MSQKQPGIHYVIIFPSLWQRAEFYSSYAYLIFFLKTPNFWVNPSKALHEPKVSLKSPRKDIFGGLFRYTEHFKRPVLNISGEIHLS